MIEELYRDCVYCGTNVYNDKCVNQCPRVTGIFPVAKHHSKHGLKCGRCQQSIPLDGFYMNESDLKYVDSGLQCFAVGLSTTVNELVPTSSETESINVSTPVCLPCKAEILDLKDPI